MTRKTLKALVFDLDDTLWPLFPLITNAEKQMHAWLAVHAPNVTKQFTVDDLKKKRLELVKTNAQFSYDLWALRHTALKNVLQEVGEQTSKADEAINLFFQARNQVDIFPDVFDVLEKMQKTHTLASISNGFADLDAIGISKFFKASLAAHTFGCAKPDPRIFLAMAEKLQLAPEEMMYIGDDLRLDIHAAQQVGMQAAWMNRQQIDLKDSAYPEVRPDFIVKDLHELLAVL